jgi:hypothetical protein
VRALAWDLLPAPYAGAAFCEFSRDEAAGLARRVQLALADCARADSDPMQTVALPHGAGFHVAAGLADLVWLACPRRPSEPYQPALFSSRAEAERAAQMLLPYLYPPADAEQEYYFNTQHFGR